jgi:hypothetical protein
MFALNFIKKIKVSSKISLKKRKEKTSFKKKCDHTMSQATIHCILEKVTYYTMSQVTF